MSKQKEVEITKDGQTATCLASAVDAWVRHGWTVVDDESSDVKPVEVVEVPTVEVVPDPATDDKE